jgi:UDP-N-acetylmuramate--alanine ligase
VPGVTGELVAEAIRQSSPDLPVHYAAGHDELLRTVTGLLEAGDLCLTLGAGDLTAFPDELMGDPAR